MYFYLELLLLYACDILHAVIGYVVIWCDVEVVFGAFRAYGNFAKAVLRATNDE